MDMDHMHHDPGLGMEVNYAFARGYWYTIAGVVGSLAAIRGINYLDAQQRYTPTMTSSVYLLTPQKIKSMSRSLDRSSNPSPRTFKSSMGNSNCLRSRARSSAVPHHHQRPSMGHTTPSRPVHRPGVLLGRCCLLDELEGF